MNHKSLTSRAQMAYFGAGVLLMKGVSLLMLPVVTHFLTPAEYGVLDVLITWMNVLGIVFGMGMAETLYRYSSKSRDPASVFSDLLQLHLWLLVPLMLLCLIVVLVGHRWLPESLQMSFLLLSLLAAGLGTVLTLPFCWLRMQGRADWFFFCSVTKVLLQAGLCWFLLEQGLGLIAVIIASVLSHLVLVVLLLWRIPFHKSWTDRSVWQGQYVRYGAPLVFSGLCLFFVCGAERWILAAVLTPADLAHYAVASQFALMVAVCIEPFTLWWFPKRLAMLQQESGLQQVANMAVLGCIGTVVAAVAIGMLGPLLIRWLLPVSYHEAAILLPWLCLAMALKQCSHLLNTGCYTQDHTHQVSKINAQLAVLAPPLYWLSCEQFGLAGLLVSLILLYALRLYWFYAQSQHLLHLPYPQLALWSVLLAGAICLFLLPYGSTASAIVAASLTVAWSIRQGLPLLTKPTATRLGEAF